MHSLCIWMNEMLCMMCGYVFVCLINSIGEIKTLGG